MISRREFDQRGKVLAVNCQHDVIRGLQSQTDDLAHQATTLAEERIQFGREKGMIEWLPLEKRTQRLRFELARAIPQRAHGCQAFTQLRESSQTRLLFRTLPW